MVYWLELDSDKLQPHSRLFDSKNMTDALKFSETLRARKHAGEPVHFIVISSENPDCVGKQGVDVTGPDYDWEKRRI